MNNFLISDIKIDELNAMVEKIMEQTGIKDPKKAVKMMNSGELKVESKWIEKDGVIHFSVTSDGTTGKEWITRLKRKGFRLDDYAESILRSKDFKPTNGIIYKIAILNGGLISRYDDYITTETILKEGARRKLYGPNAEIACLIREKFSDEEMLSMDLPYSIVVMHEPIKDPDGSPRLLHTDRFLNPSWLGVYHGNHDGRWDRNHGFAFVVSQVSNS